MNNLHMQRTKRQRRIEDKYMHLSAAFGTNVQNEENKDCPRPLWVPLAHLILLFFPLFSSVLWSIRFFSSTECKW